MATTMRVMTYEFPELPAEDILADVLQMGGLVEEKNLLNPTCEVMWPLYESLAEYVCTLSRDELQQPAFDVWCKLEYPNMHEESVGSVTSWRTISELMVAAGISDFSFRDLVKPVSSRTIRFLSGLINFAKFRKEREYSVAELQDETMPERRQQLEEDSEQIKREIAAIEEESRGQTAAVEALEAETDELYQEMSALNKKQSIFQGEIRTLKQELSSLTDAISGQNFTLQQANEEGAELRAQIVESPEKLERAVEEKKGILESTEASAEEARRSLYRWKQKLESLTKAEKKIQKLSGLSEDVHKLLTKQQAALKEVKGLKAKIKLLEDEAGDCDVELERSTLSGRHLQDMIDNAECVNLEKNKKEETACEEIKAQHANLVKKQHIAKIEIARSKGQVQYVVDKKDAVLKITGEEIRSCKEEIASIQHRVLEYYRSLVSCTGPIPQLSS